MFRELLGCSARIRPLAWTSGPHRLLVSLPSEAVRAYTHLLNSCERRLMWPTQSMAGILALLPKSAESERPVCKCPTLYRVYCKARGSYVEEWLLAQVNHWDAAIRVSSALQAALRRELGHEMARYLGLCSVGAHWDLKKFSTRSTLVALLDSR
eukprot:232919-Pyramimonas_sp.AAC.1